MKITPWDIYWITRFDSISAFTSVTSVVLTLAVVACAIAWAVSHDRSCFDEDTPKMWAKPFWACLFGAVLSWTICVFVPSTKEAVAMILVPKIAANEQVQQLPANLVQLANDWIEELKPKSKDSK